MTRTDTDLIILSPAMRETLAAYDDEKLARMAAFSGASDSMRAIIAEELDLRAAIKRAKADAAAEKKAEREAWLAQWYRDSAGGSVLQDIENGNVRTIIAG